MDHSTSDRAEGGRSGRPTEPAGIFAAAKVLLKWSLIIVPFALIASFVAIAQTRDVEPEYTAETAVLLLWPNEAPTIDEETGDLIVEDLNPLRALGGSSSTVASITVISMSGSWVTDQLLADDLSTDIDVRADSRSPIIRVSVWDSDPDVALRTSQRLVAFIEQDLLDRQNGLDAPTFDRILSQQITDSTISEPDFGSRSRARIAFIMVAIGFSCALAFLLEGLTQLWRRTRSGQRANTTSTATANPAGHRVGPSAGYEQGPSPAASGRGEVTHLVEPGRPPSQLAAIEPEPHPAPPAAIQDMPPPAGTAKGSTGSLNGGETNGQVSGRIDPSIVVSAATYAWEADALTEADVTVRAAVTGESPLVPPSVLSLDNDTSIEDLEDEDENR